MDLKKFKEFTKKIIEVDEVLREDSLQIESINDRVHFITISLHCAVEDDEVFRLKDDLQRAIDKKRHLLRIMNEHKTTKDKINADMELERRASSAS